MASIERPAIEPLRPAFRQTCHSAAELDRLRQATLDILERVGVQFQSDKALSLLADHGVRVDKATRLAKFPADLVLEAMSRAPRRFGLGARDESCAIEVGDGNTYATTDGCGVELIDFATRERRKSTKADLADVTRIQDYLSSVAFWWPTLSAGDYGETSQLHELDAGWNNTVKHLQGMVNGEREARYAVEMAMVIAGGPEELRRRPVMSDLIGTISPLVIDKDGIEAALVFAAAGVPVTFVTMPTLGTTAPATKAGAYALGSAELVAATVLLQLAYPGAPVLHSTMQSWADPRSGNFVSFPQDGRARALGTELAHHWGVPAESAACGTDSPLPGTWQAGVEEALDFVQAAQEGSELLPSIGLVNVYTLFYPEHIVLGDDIYHRARYAIMDIDLDDEGLALEAIAEVGPGGHFLGHKHTRRHMREAVKPAITHQPGPDGAFRDPLGVAREKAQWIWREYRPEPLDPVKAAELSKILKAADSELRR
ncbi:MAG TPA: trimethylamine methyltransferase family protein [Thermoleophilia bacterium]